MSSVSKKYRLLRCLEPPRDAGGDGTWAEVRAEWADDHADALSRVATKRLAARDADGRWLVLCETDGTFRELVSRTVTAVEVSGRMIEAAAAEDEAP